MQRTSEEEHQACRALLMMTAAAERAAEEQQPEEEEQQEAEEHPASAESKSERESEEEEDSHEERGGEAGHRGGKRKRVSSEDIRQCFNMPLAKAAEELGIGTTTLKRICREYGITRWPYRELKSISGSMRHLEQALLLTAQNPQDELRTQLEGRWLMLRQHKYRLLESASDGSTRRPDEKVARNPQWPPAKPAHEMRSTAVSSDDDASSREAFVAAQNEMAAKAHHAAAAAAAAAAAQGHRGAPVHVADPRMGADQYAQYLAAAAAAASAGAGRPAPMPHAHPTMPAGYAYPYPPMMGMQTRGISAPAAVPFRFDMAQWSDHHLGYSLHHHWSSSPTAVWAPEERLTMYPNYPAPPTLSKISRVKSDPTAALQQRPFLPASRQAQI